MRAPLGRLDLELGQSLTGFFQTDHLWFLSYLCMHSQQAPSNFLEESMVMSTRIAGPVPPGGGVEACTIHAQTVI